MSAEYCWGGATWQHPVGRHPVGRHPVGRHPVGRHPVGRHPVGRHPVGRHPVGRHPVGRHPVGRHPVGRHPVGRHPVGRHPVGRHPAPCRDMSDTQLSQMLRKQERWADACRRKKGAMGSDKQASTGRFSTLNKYTCFTYANGAHREEGQVSLVWTSSCGLGAAGAFAKGAQRNS
eukprot:365021-Chlamydomonas_euryale.AAC.9